MLATEPCYADEQRIDLEKTGESSWFDPTRSVEPRFCSGSASVQRRPVAHEISRPPRTLLFMRGGLQAESTNRQTGRRSRQKQFFLMRALTAASF